MLVWERSSGNTNSLPNKTGIEKRNKKEISFDAPKTNPKKNRFLVGILVLG